MSELVQLRKHFFPITELKCENIVKHNSFLKAQTPSPSQIRFVALREVKEIRNPIDVAVLCELRECALFKTQEIKSF